MVGYLSEVFVSFQGEGAYVGQRHLFLRLAGCNLRCRYCDTPGSLERTAAYSVTDATGHVRWCANPVTVETTVQTVRELIAADRFVDAIAITGGEPLVQAGFLAGVLRSGAFGLPILLETNGLLPRRLREVLPAVDIVSMDIKLPSNTGEPAAWDAHRDFLRLATGKERYVKILVDEATTDDDIAAAAQLLRAVQPALPVFLQPITGQNGGSTISGARLGRFFRTLRGHVSTVRVVPQTHKMLEIR